MFDMTEEELQAAADRIKAQTTRNPKPFVCVCGHPARAHTSESSKTSIAHRYYREQGQNVCISGRSECPCSGYTPVLKVHDVRVFRYKTRGPGVEHALAQGYAAAVAKGHLVEWMDSAVCFVCQSSEKSVVPVAYKPGYFESDEPEAINALLCAECREGIREKAMRGEFGV